MKKGAEKLLNVPNILTSLRVLITFIIIYVILVKFNFTAVVVLFIIGMLTDFFDGQIARKFKLKTEFGSKFDMIADRFLLIGTVASLIIVFILIGTETRIHMLQLLLIMTREIITFPFAIVALISQKPIPSARFVGKLTTFLQGFALPTILLSIHYPFFSFSLYLTGVTCFVGIISAITYIRDLNTKNVR